MRRHCPLKVPAAAPKKKCLATRSLHCAHAVLLTPASAMNTCMLFFCEPRGRYDEVEGFTIFDLLFDTIEPIFLCQAGSNSGWRLVYRFRDAADLGVDLLIARFYVLQDRYLAHYECPADRPFGALALRLAYCLPIKIELGRVGVVLSHLAREALEECVHLLLDHHQGHVKSITFQ